MKRASHDTGPLNAAVTTIRDRVGPLDDEAVLFATILLKVTESAAFERCLVRLTGHADAITAAARQIREALADHANGEAA